MANTVLPNLGGRPVFIASYKTSAKADATDPLLSSSERIVSFEKSPGNDNVLIRQSFPPAGTSFEGGNSDGYCYRITFAAGRQETSYQLLTSFLREQGYGDIPIPNGLTELRRFKLPPRLRHQLSIFGDNGYVHNPLKILFPVSAGKRGTLILELYNESAPNHLLRFHRR